ncbi:hypothetical protein OG535_38525 [Kitasatospora sp. NBC_00085]|uniref:hypothetical protein n=1 Tax=unclassified Kitasatospora TaxID=2633591 RepID=UPI0032532368
MNKIRSAVAVASALAAVLAAAPAAGASDKPVVVGKTCSNRGGLFYCGFAYGSGETIMKTSKGEVRFVIGLDHAVWINDDNGAWGSLGGGPFVRQVKVLNHQGDFNFTISSLDSNNVTWSRTLTPWDGWSEWYPGVPKGS